jgi:hypothetical protein
LWLRQRLAQQMPKMIGSSRMDRDLNRPQRASPEGIRSLSTLSRRTLIAESEFGLAHGDRAGRLQPESEAIWARGRLNFHGPAPFARYKTGDDSRGQKSPPLRSG